ncbi:hypothetical protein DEJ16_09340 [Curtobacterium sp. MCJR17_055]|uniref:hypothetical protein n=1 Tax=unclassified Curtobacterium TaxID=257496 RepID=UPI000DA0999A|nr:MULTISPECIES: hypothetical protein [unclassified Curtobacterium]PYY35029.1 hypothetical protein DEI87_06965 [Curtobacterium sp. MCBD17_029]PYY55691.1 hypothetical protein DEJ16_09340 [Curtobacterium sp. MCJR17_055]PYY60436.1 hypothetical protein DEJ26_06460 [Curtobacterium sp. MCPF17_015]PZE90899.1 hypothetical protein DEI95_11145 [Curtobacterium sp. MCBD17_008]WIB34980.1 hypothetical protein DEJ15_10750 [Curtobacterium sp. MCJR17_043]
MSSKTLLRPVRPPTGAPRPVSLPDRLALRLGLALIVWSRRTRRQPHEIDPAEELRRQCEHEARLVREAEWLLLVTGPRQWR